MTLLILFFLIVLIGSGICSCSEAALFSIPKLKVQELYERVKFGSISLLYVKENINRPIATIVILNNVFNIVGSMVIGITTTKVMGAEWLGWISGLLTFMIIIGSEIIPKNLGERYCENISLAIAYPLLVLSKIFLPLNLLIEFITYPITKGKTTTIVNESEIKILSKMGLKQGSINNLEEQIIKQSFELDQTTANDIMTPRTKMTYIRANKTLGEMQDFIIDAEHSRILLIRETVDDVQGVLYKDELLIALINGKGDHVISDFSNDVMFVPETTKADALLHTFITSKKHLIVVRDEFNGVSGVVTLEDVVEILTGEIVDENDSVADLRKVEANG